jgi:DNA-binding protein H-NS
VSEPMAPSGGAATAAQDGNTNGDGSTVGRGYEAKVKYRDPKTNETWSGRGRMANWLKRKQDAGEDFDDYLV